MSRIATESPGCFWRQFAPNPGIPRGFRLERRLFDVFHSVPERLQTALTLAITL
ncbi:MAG: hypothetical protein AAGA73_12915 [Pseudomonadota bacterium]